MARTLVSELLNGCTPKTGAGGDKPVRVAQREVTEGKVGKVAKVVD